MRPRSVPSGGAGRRLNTGSGGGAPLSGVTLGIPSRTTFKPREVKAGARLGALTLMGSAQPVTIPLRMPKPRGRAPFTLATAGLLTVKLETGRRPELTVEGLDDGVADVKARLLGAASGWIAIKRSCAARKTTASAIDRTSHAVVVAAKNRKRC